MIEDINDNDYKEVPGSQFVVSRTAFKVIIFYAGWYIYNV
jgi:hypothetical protein